MNTPQSAFFFNDFKNAYIPHILKEIYIDRVYQPYLEGKKDLTILDIGANIGLTSFYFKDYAKRVIAVEPSQQHADCIRSMIDYNKINNIEVLQVALGSSDTTLNLYHNTNSTMFSLKEAVKDNCTPEEVTVASMETLLSTAEVEKVDLMKLDVEGYESEVIASDSFAKCVDRLPLILGEWHTWTTMNQKQFEMCFRDLGYKFSWMNKTEASCFVAQLQQNK